MKRILLFVCILVLTSCNNKKNDQPQNNVPEVLQDNNKQSAVVSYSKRGREDLVDELYKEKLDKTPGLLAIDKLYRVLKEDKIDSLEEFNYYDQKNNEYYKTADFHLKSIQDSFLKKEIETILANSINRFHVKSGRLDALRNALSRSEVSADDRYEAVKLLITLRMMELYQDNLPSSKPIESIVASYNDLNRKLDSTINRNK